MHDSGDSGDSGRPAFGLEGAGGRISPIHVGIIEDQTDLREGMAALIADAPGFAFKGAWPSMEDAIPAVVREPPDVLLVDLGLPKMDGIEGIRQIKAKVPGVLAVVLTVYEDDDRIFDALCAGACGYLLKTTLAPQLLAGLQEAVEGGAPMSPKIARKVVGLFSKKDPAREVDARLTPHEVRVLRLMTEGHSYKSAASELGVSRSTIAFHVRKIYEKLEVQGRSEAVAKAFRGRLLR